MADKFDPYREALVMETVTVWGEEFADVSPQRRTTIESALHTDASQCSQLAYVRLTTGFCRKITVTQDDIDRADQ